MELTLPKSLDKNAVLNEVESFIGNLSLNISKEDRQRPWGGFFVIDKESESKFIDTFFPELEKGSIYKYGEELSPKILVVEPHQKLSWQYHNRRAEIWRGITGPVGVMVGNSDVMPESYNLLNSNEVIQHDNQVRHRLIGLDNWGVLAEIWQHTDPNNPSNEEDIVRLHDDYGRN